MMKRIAHYKKIRLAIGHEDEIAFPLDLDSEAIDIFKKVESSTLTGVARVFALIQAVKYIVRADIPGAIIECGVLQGGSMMAAALTLQQVKTYDRDLYLYDTYTAIPYPSDIDIDFKGVPAMQEYDEATWHCPSVEEVKSNLLSTGYPHDKMHFIKGKVEDTLPDSAPEHIALLRLDTDWYEPTKHELIHLYPRLSSGGVLLIDDYGHYQGCRKAVDDYFLEINKPILLNRIDYSGRIGIKI